MRFPSRGTIRFFLVYGVILFFVDRFLISSSRNAPESFTVIMIAVLVASVLYALLGKLFENSNKTHDDS